MTKLPSEGQLKVLARITALEVLVQHLIYVAFDRDPVAIRDYARRVREEFAEARFPGADAALSDLMASETQDALAAILNALVQRIEREQAGE